MGEPVTPGSRFRPQNRQRMVGNHPLLVGWNDEDFHAALPAGDAKGIGGIRIVIDRQPQPTEPLTNTPADLRVVLADQIGEDDTINAAERCGKRAELTGRAPDKKLEDRKSVVWGQSGSLRVDLGVRS